MKKVGFLATLAGVLFGMHGVAYSAQYPVYSGYQGTNASGQVIYLPTNPNVANPTRITGSLPRVGSNVTTAGRQYYQPSDFDRLADSGLYVGLGVAYSASVSGSDLADYMGD